MKLSVLIPAYNEAQSIAAVLGRVKSVPVEKEIIVVDDCSSDGTRDILRRTDGIRLICHETNRGKGAAIRTALAAACGDVAIIQDADLEYDPADWEKLLRPFAQSGVDAVFGSRVRGHGSFLFASRLANYFLTFITDLLFGGCLTDMETCYKAIRLPLFARLGLTANGFEIEPEITAKLLRHRRRIVEVPISYRARRTGKKIGPLDAVKACHQILKLYLS